MAGSTATTLLAVGDIGRCDSTHDDATGALAASMNGVVATLGDTAYEDGTTEELHDCFGGSWGAVKDRIRFAVTGNHDIHTDGGAPLQAYMGSAAARDGRTWFSEDLGAWHVVVLDGNCGLAGVRCSGGSEQARWLREDLAASSTRCTLALLHQPRFSSGQHGDDGVVGPLWDALYAAGADLVLDGHDHDYERFAPQDPDGRADAARGITEIVAGTGGAELEAFKRNTAELAGPDPRRLWAAGAHAPGRLLVLPFRRRRRHGTRPGSRHLSLNPGTCPRQKGEPFSSPLPRYRHIWRSSRRLRFATCVGRCSSPILPSRPSRRMTPASARYPGSAKAAPHWQR